MSFRVYVDESGTHGDQWLIIGMLFVPDHGSLHSALCQAKEQNAYFNKSIKRKARYKEIHFTDFRTRRDVAVGKQWIDLFLQHHCYFRSIVVDWSVWDGRYFGNPFDPEALKKRRAYKKWAEMLLHPELKASTHGSPIYHARFFLDRLRIMYGYDILDHLSDRFNRNYYGESPHIESFQHTDSWRDANQCLQLCDLLVGCLYQELVPSSKQVKLETRDYLAQRLAHVGVKRLAPEFWKQYDSSTLSKHFPKFSAWFWRPSGRLKKKQRKKKHGL